MPRMRSRKTTTRTIITRRRGGKKITVITGVRPTRKIIHKIKKGSVGVTGPTKIVSIFLHMLNTVKLYHWRTTSYATHKATDELYSSLNSKLDEFVEVMLGKDELGGRMALLNVDIINLDVFNDTNEFKGQVEIYKNILLGMSNDPVLSAPINTDLLAIRDEILALFNQFLYLLSLD